MTQCIVQEVPLSRTSFSPDFVPTWDEGDQCVCGPEDFCINCGSDLRVRRRIVSQLAYDDVVRLHICEVALHALYPTGTRSAQEAAVEDCQRLELSRETQQRLANLVVEGYDAAGIYVVCGMIGCELVGITEEGILLYAREGTKCQIET